MDVPSQFNSRLCHCLLVSCPLLGENLSCLNILCAKYEQSAHIRATVSSVSHRNKMSLLLICRSDLVTFVRVGHKTNASHGYPDLFLFTIYQAQESGFLEKL